MTARMTKNDFLAAVRNVGAELAIYAARITGVSRAQTELWALAA